MSKSIKLNNDTYIDGSAIRINRKTMLDYFYPVGSIYISVNSTSPETLFGGTWEQIKDTFLLSAGDTYSAGSTGGEAEHTLTTNEIPSHSHSFQIASGTLSSTGYAKANQGGTYSMLTTRTTGGDQPHNNMPPYLTVYVWKRTA